MDDSVPTPRTASNGREVQLKIRALIATGWLAGSAAAGGATASKPPQAAHAVVQMAIDAIGGTEHLLAIRAIRTKSMGYNHHLEQSERPEGPWIVTYTQVNELRDFEHARLRHEEQARSFFNLAAEWKPLDWIFEDGAAANVRPDGTLAPRDVFTAQQAEEALALGPERVCLTALAAGDLRLEPDVSYRGHAHAVAAFTWRDARVRILISRESGLPSAVDSTRSHPESVFWGPWGDVTFRKSYALWMLEKNGVRLPRTVFTEWNGFPLASQTADEVVINPAVSEPDLTIPSDVKQAFANRRRSAEDLPLGRPGTTPQEIAKGVTLIPGPWNVTLIQQSDGLVIVEGPISSGYSAKVIAEAQRRHPGARLKAVVTTSDAWPHIGGMREYAARGVPIYALDHNQPILERLMKAPRRITPDALASSPKPARFNFVSQRTTIGSGPNRFELIPLRTATGERQMALWLPEHKLVYCSDLFQRDQNGEFFLPQMLSEMVSVVEREHLDVKAAFAMHLALTPWDEVLTALRHHLGDAAK